MQRFKLFLKQKNLQQSNVEIQEVVAVVVVVERDRMQVHQMVCAPRAPVHAFGSTLMMPAAGAEAAKHAGIITSRNPDDLHDFVGAIVVDIESRTPAKRAA